MAEKKKKLLRCRKRQTGHTQTTTTGVDIYIYNQ